MMIMLMAKNENDFFYQKLNDYYLSDWVNYPIVPYNDDYEEGSLSIVNKITKLMYDCFAQIQFNNQEKGMRLIEKVSVLIQDCSLYNFQFDFELVKINMFISTYRFVEALNGLESVRTSLFDDNKYFTIHYIIRRAVFLKLLAVVYQELNQLDKAIETCNKGLEVSIKSNFDHKKFEFHLFFAKIYKFMGKFAKATDSAIAALLISLELKDIQKQISCYLMLGGIEGINRNLKKSIEYDRRSVILARQSNSQHLYNCLNNSAMDLWLAGYLNAAFPLLLESEEIVVKINNERILSRTYNNLALLLVTKGDYDLAEKYLLKSLELKEHSQYNTYMANTFMNLGELYKEKGDLESAEYYYNKCFEVSTNLNDLTVQVQALCGLILVYCSLEDFDKSLNCHIKLTKLMEFNSSEINKTRYDLATGVILEASNNFDKITEAKVKFETIIQENYLDFDITITSYLYYCKTFFKLYTLFNLDLPWDKLTEYLDIIQKKAEKLNIYNTYFICKLLSSKFELLNNNLNTAENMLKEVIEDSKTRGFDSILKMAQDSMEHINIIKFANDNISENKLNPPDTIKIIEKDIINFISNLT